jgi:hypothetical protein
MNLPEFLKGLFAEGRVAAPAPAELASDDLSEAALVLEEQDELCRLDAPEGLPAYDSQAATWAAIQFYHACQITMFRDIGEDAIAKLRDNELKNWGQAEAHYSVDLSFRFLPDLIRIARSMATDDPLVNLLMDWCRRWPLSSVGVKGTGDVQLGPIGESPGLMSMYVDRVLAREAAERVGNGLVAREIRRALGLYSNLSPKLADCCKSSGG